MKYMIFENENREKINEITSSNRIDIRSILKLKPTKLIIRNYYLSQVDMNEINKYEYNRVVIEDCYINGSDNSFLKEKKTESIINIKKVSRFEIMDI